MALMSLVKHALPLALVFGSFSAHAKVWQTENQWSDAYEQRFSEFIRTIDTNIFMRSRESSKWGQLLTDCADAAYTLRIIFAYENKLPVSFDTWDGIFTNNSTAFDEYESGTTRVRRFIARVNYNTDTKTIVRDTYPIAIQRGILRAGTLFVHAQGGSDVPLTYRAGHVYYIQDVPDNGIIRYMSSTVPAAVRELDIRNGIQFAPMRDNGGYRNWKWPDSESRPNYSTEQFQMGGWVKDSYRDMKVWVSWQKAIVQRVRTRAATNAEELNAMLENVQLVVHNRVAVVDQGWAFYRSNYSTGQCMNGSDYDDHSTPTRDVKIQVELRNFEAAARKYVNAGNGNIGSLYKQIKFRIMDGIEVDVNQLKRTFLTETALSISEPEHSREVRWGLQAQGRWPCPERAKAYVGGENIR